MAQSSSAARSRRAATAIALTGAALLSAGCSQPPRAPAARAAAPPAAAVGTPAAELLCVVDGARSEVRILVYRGGPLGFLGHNHVLLARGLSGEVRERRDGRGGRFELSVPVAALEIDAPAARREAGPDFSSEPSSADIAGTREHLLGAEQLDAAAFPAVRVVGRLADAAASLAAVEIELRGRATHLSVPVTVTRDGPLLSVSGELPLSQQSLGLTPYSALGGALQVRDQLQLRFRIVAVSRGGA